LRYMRVYAADQVLCERQRYGLARVSFYQERPQPRGVIYQSRLLWLAVRVLSFHTRHLGLQDFSWEPASCTLIFLHHVSPMYGSTHMQFPPFLCFFSFFYFLLFTFFRFDIFFFRFVQHL
jgi:hypothetical protein